MKKSILFLLAGFLVNILMYAQTVTTFTDGTPDDAIALDANGNIYASNFVGDSVFKFDSNGTATTFVSGLNTPNGIDFDTDGNLYLCDFSANELIRYDSTGVLDTSITIPGNPSGMIKAIDNDDMIYTRYSGNTINRITPTGVITEVSSDSGLNGPVGLAYDENGGLYVANYNNREIFKVLANGDLQYIATVGGASNLGFITYAHGMLWGTVLGEHKIYKINPNAVDDVALFAGSSAGSADGDISVATFNQPNGIRFSDDGNIMYVTDFGSKNLRVISGILSANDFEINGSFLKVFPNPVKDILNYKLFLNESDLYKLKIYDTSGRVVYSREGVSEGTKVHQNIDVSSWANGAYFMEVKIGNQVVTKKIVK